MEISLTAVLGDGGGPVVRCLRRFLKPSAIGEADQFVRTPDSMGGSSSVSKWVVGGCRLRADRR